MSKIILPQHWGCVAVFAALALLAPVARSQEFALRAAQSLSLDCAADDKSYSFDAIRAPQEPGTAASIPPKAAVKSDDLREGAWRKLPANFVHDQKDMWLFPLKVAEGHYWLPTVLVIAATAALIYTDPKTEPHFRQTDPFQDSDHALGGTVSGGVIAAVPAVFYVASLVRKDDYGQATSLLAGEAVVDDTVLMVVAKAITRRLRPSDIPVYGNYNDTFFQQHKGTLGAGSSFPSGHAMMSFSVAAIFAHRYRQHRWVPFVAYGVATAISFSRLTTGAHFPSDVLFGAATGFAIARFDVLHGQ
jgi:membrane-associated phospholipid phosphatase